MSAKEDHEPPSLKALEGGYNQTYLIMARDKNNSQTDGEEVFFRCGNWCYKGLIQFNDLKVGLDDLPVLIPALQRQQGSLRYYCNAKSVPLDSDYSDPLVFLEETLDFLAEEIVSDNVNKELRKMSNVFPWIDDDTASTYFELQNSNVPDFMSKVSLIASKTYTRGLIIISIYFENTIYVVIQNGEGDQPLLDVRFPDVSKHGQGLHISSYNDHTVCYRKLTLWHILGNGISSTKKEIPKIKTLNVSSKNYEQTYCILKSSWNTNSPTLSVHHDVLFRFGSWCYSGRVQLTPSLNMADIPFIIPALRMQQSRLDFLCDVTSVPTTSPFASSLEYIQHISPLIANHITNSEEILNSLIERLNCMGLGESVSNWLEGDSSNSFFEFKIVPDEKLSQKFKNVELVVSKCYHASGIVTIIIVFQFTIYVSVLENDGESPLLDSRFPDISGKGRGYQLEAFNEGYPEWETLRKVSIWQTVQALEREFRQKAAQFAESKRQEGNNNKELDESFDEKTDYENQNEDNPDDRENKNEYNKSDNKVIDDPETEVPNSKADNKESIIVTSTESNKVTSPDPVGKRLVSLPHHVPKMESLSQKLDDMRKNMGDSGLKAPWDSRGKPLGSISSSLNEIGSKK